LLEAIPRIGKKTSGRSAVAAKGIASVTQNTDIIMAQAAILLVCIFSPKFANNIINRGRAMPTTNPTLFIIVIYTRYLMYCINQSKAIGLPTMV